MIRRVKPEIDAKILKEAAEKYLEPYYGNQNKTLEWWLESKHYKQAFVSVIDWWIRWILSLKVRKEIEYLKISTLLVLEDFQWNKIGKELLYFAENFARWNNFSSIKLTVSEEKQEALAFFKKNGFYITDILLGKYKAGINENILFKKL